MSDQYGDEDRREIIELLIQIRELLTTLHQTVEQHSNLFVVGQRRWPDIVRRPRKMRKNRITGA
jgi:hypothetical protein